MQDSEFNIAGSAPTQPGITTLRIQRALDYLSNNPQAGSLTLTGGRLHLLFADCH